MPSHAVVVHNPISGRGRAAAYAESLQSALEAAGHRVRACATRRGDPAEWLDPIARDADAIIVAGGDGAVRLAAGSAIRTGAAIHHAPFGTENLFARGFGMVRDPAAIAAALDARRVRWLDTGRMATASDDDEGTRFVLMVSLGFDAAVVHDLAARRSGRITHLTYAAPIVRQLLRRSWPRYTVRVDGAPMLEDRAGLLLVGNAPFYMRGLNPAGRARMDDGLLDVVLLPARSPWGLLRWALACARGRHLGHPRVPYARGTAVEIDASGPAPVQIDGDRPEEDRRAMAQHLRVTVERGVLPVLLPA